MKKKIVSMFHYYKFENHYTYFFTTMEVNNGNLGSICLNVSLLQVWEPFYMLLRQLTLKVVM